MVERQVTAPELEPNPGANRRATVEAERDTSRRRPFEEARQTENLGLDRQEELQDRIFRLQLSWLSNFSTLGKMAAYLTFGLMVWLLVIVLVHYTSPWDGWLDPKELGQLWGFYGGIAKVVSPLMLMSNAWLIWSVSRPRL